MVIAFAVVLTGIRIDNSDTVKTLRYKTWDHFQQAEPRQAVSDKVVVINITESDIKKYGQWPWPRHILAMFHANLTDSGAVLVNYNILFAEADRMSGKEYLKNFPFPAEVREQLAVILADTDKVFAFSTTFFAYSLKFLSKASLKQTALAAITCIKGPPCEPGNIAELNFFINSSLFVKIIPPLGPLKTLWVVEVTTSAYSSGFG